MQLEQRIFNPRGVGGLLSKLREHLVAKIFFILFFKPLLNVIRFLTQFLTTKDEKILITTFYIKQKKTPKKLKEIFCTMILEAEEDRYLSNFCNVKIFTRLILDRFFYPRI